MNSLLISKKSFIAFIVAFIILTDHCFGQEAEIKSSTESSSKITTTTASGPSLKSAFPSNPLDGIAFDEIIVESNLNVRKKTQPLARRQRRGIYSLQPFDDLINKSHNDYVEHSKLVQRKKRQFFQNPHYTNQLGFYNQKPFGSSSSSANANAHSQGFNRSGGFGSAASQAQAQGFQSQGQLGGFGASAANTGTQSFQAGPNGILGSSGISASQVYNLPNGQSINFALTDGFSIGPNGQPARASSNSISFNG